MTEKNIFVYKLFLSLKILVYFLCKNYNPTPSPENVTPFLAVTPP